MQSWIHLWCMSFFLVAIFDIAGVAANVGTKATAPTESRSTSKKIIVTVSGIGIGLQEDGDGFGRGKGDIAILWYGYIVDNENGVTFSGGSSADYGVITKVEGVGDGNPVNDFADIAHPMLTLQDDNICCDLGDYFIQYYTYDVDGSELFDIWASYQVATGSILSLATGNPAWTVAGAALGQIYSQIGDLVEGLDPTGKRINFLPAPIVCCLEGDNQGCTLDNDDALYLDASETKYNGTIRNRWLVSATGDCISEVEADEPVPFSGDIKRVIIGQNGGSEFNGTVSFPEIHPLSGIGECVYVYLDTDNDPQSGAPCGPEKGADNYYLVCGSDTTLTEEYGWWDISIACHPVLHADFGQDDLDSAPNLSLPGGATNDQLTLNESGGTVRVVSSAGNMMGKPVLITKNSGAGTAGFSAFVCAGSDCDTQTVAWSSLALQTTNSTMLSMIGSLGTTIANLQYGNSGQLLYNGAVLPTTFAIGLKQDFEITVRFAAQRTDLKINGIPVSGFQNRPFVQASADLNEFKCQLSGTAAQQFAIDNILACTKCGGWNTDPYTARSVSVAYDSSGTGLSSLHFSLNPYHFFGQGSIDSLGVRVVSLSGFDISDVSPHEDSAMIQLAWKPDSLSPRVTNSWIIGDTATLAVVGVAFRLSEPGLTIPNGSIHVQPNIPFTYAYDGNRLLTVNFTPTYGNYTVSLDSTIEDSYDNNLVPFTRGVVAMNKEVDTVLTERDAFGNQKSKFAKGDTIRIAATRPLRLPQSSTFRAYVVANDSAVIGKALRDLTSDGYNVGTTDIGGRLPLMNLGRLNQVGEFNTILDFDQDGIFDVSDRPSHRGWLELYSSASLWTSEYCGDANGDGTINISDAVSLIAYIFSGGVGPDPLQLGDADGSNAVTISDAVYIINFIFAGGPTPQCP